MGGLAADHEDVLERRDGVHVDGGAVEDRGGGVLGLALEVLRDERGAAQGRADLVGTDQGLRGLLDGSDADAGRLDGGDGGASGDAAASDGAGTGLPARLAACIALGVALCGEAAAADRAIAWARADRPSRLHLSWSADEGFRDAVSLPPLWLHISRFNPFFYLIDGFRFGFFGQSDVSPFMSLAVASAAFVLVASLAVYLLKIGYKIRH